jgi:hypothetical protein
MHALYISYSFPIRPYESPYKPYISPYVFPTHCLSIATVFPPLSPPHMLLYALLWIPYDSLCSAYAPPPTSLRKLPGNKETQGSVRFQKFPPGCFPAASHCIPAASRLQNTASRLHPSCIPAASRLHPGCKILHPGCIPAASQLHPTASQLHPSCIPAASQLHATASHCIPAASLLHPTASQLHPNCIPGTVGFYSWGGGVVILGGTPRAKAPPQAVSSGPGGASSFLRSPLEF